MAATGGGWALGGEQGTIVEAGHLEHGPERGANSVWPEAPGRIEAMATTGPAIARSVLDLHSFYAFNPERTSFDVVEYCPNISRNRIAPLVWLSVGWVSGLSMPVVQSRSRMVSYPRWLIASVP